MLRTLFIFICLSISFHAFASDQVSYYDSSWTKTGKRNAVYYRISVKENDTTYKTDDYFMSGKLFRSGYRRSIDEEGYYDRIGHYTYYDVLGNKLREGDFVFGERTGAWKYYYTGSPALRYESEYEKGNLLKSTYYDSASQRITSIAVHLTGETRTSLYEDGDSTLIISKYNKNERETIEYYSNGKVKKKKIYAGDKITSLTCYNVLGNIIDCDTTSSQKFTYEERMPEPAFDLSGYLHKSLKYPKKARKAGIEGRVVTKFVVEEDGTVSTLGIASGFSEELDAEALRVLSEMPLWKPGLQNGQAVCVYFNLPIVFKLQ